MKKKCRSVDGAEEIACEAVREIRAINLRPERLYKRAFLIVLLAIFTVSPRTVKATQADDTTITITGQTPGSVPFLSQLTLSASDTSVIRDVQFTISPKPGSVTRPLSGTFSNDYLVEQGYLVPSEGEIFLPVYGLYDGYANTVTLTYRFFDGSSKQDTTTITTTSFADPCGYNNPTYLQHRTDSTSLSYDYILIKGSCDSYSPAIIDTDGALRWMVPVPLSFAATAGFFDNAVFYAYGAQLYRVNLDGAVTPVANYSGSGVSDFHHNMDRGKTGILLEADTPDQVESTIIEVDYSGNIIKTWHMDQIISAAMLAGGDDPDLFVYPSPTDWFHNNAVTYNRADDSLIVSSRENFLICIDYETGAIKWILGDSTKLWHLFPSLNQYALTLPAGSLPPIGQHAVSITYDQNIMVFDNGLDSFFQQPPGDSRSYASPRKYRVDLTAKTATEVWNYEMGQSVVSPVCGSVYEDAPLDYLIDYADVNGLNGVHQYAQLIGLDAAGEKIFYFQYPSAYCFVAFNSVPLHLESTSFPAVESLALNLSTRGLIGTAEDSLIGGFIVTGTDAKRVVLRALGPSLQFPNAASDPALSVFDSNGHAIASNDDWQTDPGAAEIAADGLAPTDAAEAATVQSLVPGAYTFVVTQKDTTPGIGLVEAYDLSPLAGSKLANLSTRGLVETDDNVLISGFIVGEVGSNTLVIRALGPSLAPAGISDPLSDPILTVYDSNGVVIGGNDNWEDDSSALQIEENGLAPSKTVESATILHLPAGAYTAIVTGSNGSTGVGLVELFDL
jgi:arylsulfate sulfotransferase